MAGIYDQHVTVGVESSYGTAQLSTVRSFEAKTDAFTRDVEYIQSVGFRRDLQTIRSDRDDTISLEPPVQLSAIFCQKAKAYYFSTFSEPPAGPHKSDQLPPTSRPLRQMT
jgi:hypothetical protein